MTIEPVTQNALHQNLLLNHRSNDIEAVNLVCTGGSSDIVQIEVGDCSIYHITPAINNGIVHQGNGYR
jgi:hypothetical protein